MSTLIIQADIVVKQKNDVLYIMLDLGSCTLELEQESLELLPEKAIFWKQQSALILSDVHLGKIAHFRKAGIGVPKEAAADSLGMLEKLVNSYQATDVYILGDLFHSHKNEEWDHFVDFLYRNSHLQFHLVMGNHDILSTNEYDRIPMAIHPSTLELGPFIFSHEPLPNPAKFNIHGHIHPAVRISGKAKQSIRLPCYYFTQSHGILLAFGKFTGNYTLDYKVADSVFLITGERVLKLEL